MANGQINRLLEFANLQMAAEAFLSQEGDDAPDRPPVSQVKARLELGNNHASKFTPIQADQFVAKYEVLTQFRNDSLRPGNSGFSGTLIRNKESGELTLAIRSTEFFDDPIRDSKATNDLELKDLGWGFGQISELESWYNELRSNPAYLADGSGGVRRFNVTGYSLGGHVATAFNILRREEAAATGAPNPIIWTYTFNGSGTGDKPAERTLASIIAEFARIRADYSNSPEWLSLGHVGQQSLIGWAQTRINAIRDEYARVLSLRNVNPSFGQTGPIGVQEQLAYQIAAWFAARDTVPMWNPFYPVQLNFIPIEPQFAPAAALFGNMTEVVGMEYSPLALASSFISNGGIHHGPRQEVHIENQPLFRGDWTSQVFDAFPSLLVNDPDKNNFADPHSLVLLIDSLSLMAAMETLAPALMIEEAGLLYAAISNKAALTRPLTQGRSEGDTLERMLGAMRKLALGPTAAFTLSDRQMLNLLNGNTWHEAQYRTPFQNMLKELQDRINVLVAAPEASFTIDSLVNASVAQLASLAQGATTLAYRYALKELNPFAVVGVTATEVLYNQHNARGELDFYDPTARTGDLTSSWIADRATFLALKNAASLANVTQMISTSVEAQTRFSDVAQRYNLLVDSGGQINVSRHFLFGSDKADKLTGATEPDRLYGGGAIDHLVGRGGNDYLEGGRGLDLYQYDATTVSGPVNDGDDVIRDVDGNGALRYTFKPALGGAHSTIIADASDRRSDTQWRSANDKFIFTQTGADLVVTVNGDAGGTITLKDFRNGDFGIHLRDPRPAPQNPTREFYGDKQDYDADPNASGIQLVADGFGNYQRADGQDGRPDLASPDREDIFYGSIAAGDVELFLLGDGNDQALADGNQLYPASGAAAWMQGGSGRDMLHGGPADDLIEAGSDGTLLGELGGDTAFGGFGDDEIHGDVKITLADAVTQGATGAGTGLKGDFLSGGPDDDRLFGSSSNGYLDGGSGSDLIVGGAGDDNIAGDYGYGAITPNWVITREIVSQVDSTRYQLVFASGMDWLDTGAAGDDVIYAGGGVDWIFANGGDDFVDAGADNDVAFGEAGADVLVGDAGDDRLVGDNPGIVFGADEGGDVLDGGAGNDELFGNGGDDILAGGDAADLLIGDAGADILSGDEGDDVLVGDNPGLVLAADEGADYLDGGDGNDTLQGNGGNDTLVGGPGDDVLSGGPGRDTYVFNRGNGVETIFDTDTSAEHPDASVLVLGEGIDRADIKFSTGSLLVDLGNGDMLHFHGFDQIDPANSAPLAEIQLADGTLLDYGNILEQGFDIDGTAGNDNSQPGQSPNLLGTGVTDRIRGFAGDDILFGRAGDDVLDGGEGTDSLVGGAGADTMHGGAGDDGIWGAGDDGGVIAPDGADIVYAGFGDDHIEGADGDDQLFGEAGADRLYGQADSDLLDGGDGNDELYGDGIYFVIDQFVLNFFDDGAADTLRAGSGDDYLNGAGGDDLLEGGSGNDHLVAASGNDTLLGDEGDDILEAGAGDDILSGGPGLDSLQGQAGDDIYLFEAGDGEDLLIDESNTTLDILRFGDGIATGDIAFAHGPYSSLVAWHSNGVDQTTIQNWYVGTANRLDYFEFPDATQVTAVQAEVLAATSWRGGSGNDALSGSTSADTIVGLGGNDTLSSFDGNDILIGGAGDDTMQGGLGSDTYRIGLGDGVDTIFDTSHQWNDTLIFEANVARTDVSYERAGVDLVMRHVNGFDRVIVSNWFTDPFLYDIDGVTFLSDGTTYSGLQIQTFATVIAHQYSLALGDGAKVIEDWGGVDTLTFGAGIVKANIQPSRVGVDLKLAHTNGVDQVTIKDWFDDTVKQIESVTFSASSESFTQAELTDPFLTINGTAGNDTIEGGGGYAETLNGLAGNDTIIARAGSDLITGGLGNDTLSGGPGADRYFFKSGDGSDVIHEEGGDRSVLQLAPGLIDVVISTFITHGRYRITFTGSSDSVDVFETGFGGMDLKGELNGTSAGNTLTGNDTYGDVIQGLGGNDTIEGRGGDDEIDGGTGADTIAGGAGNDAIHGGAGNDIIEGGADGDQLWGDDGDDLIDGDVQSATGHSGDYFWGGPGNDTLYGNYRADRYHYNLSDGLDVVIDEPFLNEWGQWVYSTTDQLAFGPGIDAESLTISPAGNDLLVTLSPTDKVTLRNWISDYTYRVDEFVFSGGSKLNADQILLLAYTQRGTSGNDTLTGTANNDALYGMGGNDTLIGSTGNDLLDGGSGNDTMDGGSGDDRYFFGAGQDRIVDVQGNDRVEFAAGVTAAQITLGRSLNSLVLGVAGTADTLTIDNFLINTTARVESFVFTDASALPDNPSIVDSLVGVFGTPGNDVLQGTNNFDVLYGYAGNDTLTALGDHDIAYGGDGDDALDGGTGNDDLRGEAGNDTYNYALGGGGDVVTDSSGADAVAFGAGIATGAVTPTRSGANLILNVNITGNVGAVTVTNYFSGQETEEIRFADGTTWDVATVKSKVLAAAATAGNDVILGYDSADTINSLAGNDTVYGGAGNDVIDGGTGSDTLFGEGGNDIVRAGTGDAKNASVNNYLYGGTGDDVLVASGKTDSLFGEAGNDIALGAGGNETLQDGGGSNLLFGGAGADTVRPGDGNDLVLAGTGNDTIDGDSDANAQRGRDVIAFNKSDGVDTLSRLGAGSTISIGGGTTYSNLSFAFSGANLLLKTSNSNSISLLNWYGSPGEKNVSALQIVIEGTSNYNAGSSNPLNNRKIQTFDFQSLVGAYDAAGRPGNFSIANNLAAHRIGGSDTQAIGGAAAYQYARTGTPGTLTNAQMQAVINDPAFAVSAQSITPAAAQFTEGSALDDGSATLAAEFSVAGTSEAMQGPGEPADDPASKAKPAPTSADASIASAGGAESVTPISAADIALFDRAPQPDAEAPAIAAKSAADAESAALIAHWFEGASRNDDLSLLDDILRGDDGVALQTRSAIAAQWERTHHWLNRNGDARLGESVTAGDGGSQAFTYFGMGQPHETPRAAIGLADVAGHEMKVFSGLPA